MIQRITGIVLIATGFIGYMFFSHYRGEMISSPTLCLLASIALGLVGLLLMLTSRTRKEVRAERTVLQQIAWLKSTGEKILLNYDNCEFMANAYSEEVQDDSRARSYDVLFNQQTSPLTTNIARSAVVYTNRIGQTSEQFRSPSFPVSEVSLKASVLNGEVTLYVDRQDRRRYYFELKP